MPNKCIKFALAGRPTHNGEAPLFAAYARRWAARTRSMLDALVPEIERLQKNGAVVLLKWDGERSKDRCTVVVAHAAKGYTFRRDSEDIQSSLREAINDYWSRMPAMNKNKEFRCMPNNRVEHAHGVRSTHKRPCRLFAAHAGRWVSRKQ
jgi:hypothetical protein